MSKYVYPKGDFLSGFSEGEEPCDYELECQRMVIRGLEYLDQHPEIFDLISQGGISVYDKVLNPMIEFMCGGHENDEENSGQTAAMVSHSVKHAYVAKKFGWEQYINQLTETNE
jgi:hypothetical protein